MIGDLTLARRRADDARYELSHAIHDTHRPGVDPTDAVRALHAAMVRAIAKLEEADRLLDAGILDASSQLHVIRDLEVQLAYEKGGEAAADAVIDARYAPRTDAMPPGDEPDGRDWPESDDAALALANAAIDLAIVGEDHAHDFADRMLELVEMPGAVEP